ncbi:S8 family serine peptidase [Paenibacillus tritici]|uniref:S8 family serine peptidase n=1 Tax=Paenibacillus tritici TaxID=1873425 RepID=A0ABX2DUW4_9BACL|nr:S8 family serine peptidase [Paenibacillus tritici]
MYNTRQAVIIDTGIDMTNCSLAKHVINGNGFKYVGNRIIEEDHFQDENGHGTTCADTILQVFSEAQFYVIKIANSEGKTSTELLQRALKQCLTLNIKFICVSLALTKELYQQDLSEIIQLLENQNKLVFVSVRNGSKRSYPACLSGVIGVGGLPYCSKKAFSYSAHQEIQGVFDDSPIFVYTLAGRFTFFKGTSKANALCVGMSMKILTESLKCNEELTFSEFNDLLEQYARQHEVAELTEVIRPVTESDKNECSEQLRVQIERVMYRITGKELEPDLLLNGPFISQTTGINFNNFYDFWKALEEEIGFTIQDYHQIRILDACSYSALLSFLEGVMNCRTAIMKNV